MMWCDIWSAAVNTCSSDTVMCITGSRQPVVSLWYGGWWGCQHHLIVMLTLMDIVTSKCRQWRRVSAVWQWHTRRLMELTHWSLLSLNALTHILFMSHHPLLYIMAVSHCPYLRIKSMTQCLRHSLMVLSHWLDQLWYLLLSQRHLPGCKLCVV